MHSLPSLDGLSSLDSISSFDSLSSLDSLVCRGEDRTSPRGRNVKGKRKNENKELNDGNRVVKTEDVKK